MTSPTESRIGSTTVAVAVSAVAIGLLCAKVIAQVKFPNLKFDDASTIALIVFAAVPWLARTFEIIKFGDFEFKFLNLEAHQAENDKALRAHAEYLAQLFNGFVGVEGRRLLLHLRDNKPFNYTFSVDTKQEYRTMLRQLRFLGFIDGKESIVHIIDDQRPEVDLNKEFVLTSAGKRYLESPIARDAEQLAERHT